MNNTHAMNETEKQNEDFDKLTSIVCDVYRVDRHNVVSKKGQYPYAVARAIIAAIWSESHTLKDAAKRCIYAGPSAAFQCRGRMKQILLKDDVDSRRCKEIIRRVSKEIPWVLGVYAGADEE